MWARLTPYGAGHGFSTTVTGRNPGPHSVCACGIATGPLGANTTLGCTTGSVPYPPPILSSFVPVAPARLLDTRSNGPQVG